MKRCRTPKLLAVMAMFCLSLIAVSGYAQFQTGNIYGKVQAKDGSVLPGVTVVLTGVGAPSTQITDSQGNFRYLNLSPATYTLKAELAGYGSATRSGLGVNVGRNSDVTLTLNPSVSESITVTAEAPLLDVRKAGTSTNVTKVELESVPSSRDPWGILTTAPSVQVDRINVGGSQSGQQSNYIGKGANSSQNTWNVDGVNITDMGATGSTPLYFDFDSFEEMQVTTGGSDPRVQTPGVQLNMVTKRGTNDFRGSGRDFYTPGSYQADASVPGEAAGYLEATNRINYVRDYGAEIGGPIWKDHAWFWAASSVNKISNQASSTLSSSGKLRVGAFDNIVLRDKNAKINAQLLPSNSAVGFYTFGDKIRNARNIGPTRPFETAWRQGGPTKVYKLEDTQIIGSSLYLTGMWSKVTGGFGLFGNGGVGRSAPPMYLDADSIWHQNYYTYSTVRPQKQYRLDGSKFIDIGSMNNEFKFGFGYRKTPVVSSTVFPGASNGYWDFSALQPADCAAEGLPANCAVANLIRDSVKGYDEKYNDGYLGDTLLLGNLTLQAGLRYDSQQSKNSASVAEANPVIGTGSIYPCTDALPCPGGQRNVFIPAQVFTGDTRTLKWNNVTPRLGLTYALGADKRTLVRAGYNRYVSQMGSIIAAANPIGYNAYAVFYGVDKNNDKLITRDELLKISGFAYIDPDNPAAVSSTTRVDYSAKAPTTDEFILGGEHELLTDFSVGVNYSYRKYKDLIQTRFEKTQGKGDFYTSADYEVAGNAGGTFTLKDPKTGAVITTFTTPTVPVYQLKAGIASPVFGVITNRPDYTQTYNGLELTATKRLSHKWMMRGNVTYSDWKQKSGANAYANPTPALRSGYDGCYGNCNGQVFQRSGGSGSFANVFINSKWNANLTGLYQLPWDFNIGGSFTARQGYPALYRQSTTGLRGGNVGVILNPVGDERFANVYELDLRAAKDFRFFNRVGITLSGDLFNVTNQRTVLQRETNILTGSVTKAPTSRSAGNRLTELQSPRVWRFGAKVSF